MMSSVLSYNPENELLLDQSLLKSPVEMIRRELKGCQKAVEKDGSTILASTSELLDKVESVDLQELINKLDDVVQKAKVGLSKIEALEKERDDTLRLLRSRYTHLSRVFDYQSHADQAFQSWARIRLDRFLVDYMLRNGMTQTGVALARSREIQDLVDMQVFRQCGTIEQALVNNNTAECLAWCAENRSALRKINSDLEFQVRMQEYIELIRLNRKTDALAYAKKHLANQLENHCEQVFRASSLLSYSPNSNIQPYTRWNMLAASFVSAHHTLYSLSDLPLLHVALQTGLSALKTPCCYSKVALPTIHYSDTSSALCPICSSELNELARHVPYTQHSRHIVDDPVALPNGRVFSRRELEQWCDGHAIGKGLVQDPVTGDIFKASELERVIT